jgi:ABC-type nitrate/sulfonate/bicarbonate transport system substrate-binding protein
MARGLARRELLAYVTAIGAWTLGGAGVPGRRTLGLGQALAAAPELKSVTAWGVIDAQISSQQILAAKKGYFTANGLDVKNRLVQSGPDIGPLISGGSAQVSFETTITVIIVNANNVNAVIVTPLANIGGTQAVVARRSLALRSAKDLEGKRIGMAEGAGVFIAIRNMGKAMGVDISKLKFINMLPADQVAALSRGDIDLMACWEPWVTKAIEAGGEFLFSGKLSNLPGKKGPVDWMNFHSTMQVTRDFLTKNPETITRMLMGLREATEFVNAHRTQAIDLLAPELHLKKTELAAMMNRNVYSMVVDDSFRQDCDAFTSFLYGGKKIPTEPNIRHYTDFSMLARVDPSLVKVKI